MYNRGLQGDCGVMHEGRDIERDQHFGKTAAQALMGANTEGRIYPGLPMLGPFRCVTVDIETVRLREVFLHQMGHGKSNQDLFAGWYMIASKLERVSNGPHGRGTEG